VWEDPTGGRPGITCTKRIKPSSEMTHTTLYKSYHSRDGFLTLVRRNRVKRTIALFEVKECYHKTSKAKETLSKNLLNFSLKG
jgi:hypothetical protein